MARITQRPRDAFYVSGYVVEAAMVNGEVHGATRAEGKMRAFFFLKTKFPAVNATTRRNDQLFSPSSSWAVGNFVAQTCSLKTKHRPPNWTLTTDRACQATKVVSKFR